MTTNDFYLYFNVTGTERKRLVQAISAYTGADAKYLGAPSFAYTVDYFTIDRNSVVSFDDRADSEEFEGLIEALVNDGFVSQVSNLGCEEDADSSPQEGDTAPENETTTNPTETVTAPRNESVGLLTAPADLAGYKAAITEALYKGTKRNIESEKGPKNAVAR